MFKHNYYNKTYQLLHYNCNHIVLVANQQGWYEQDPMVLQAHLYNLFGMHELPAHIVI